MHTPNPHVGFCIVSLYHYSPYPLSATSGTPHHGLLCWRQPHSGLCHVPIKFIYLPKIFDDLGCFLNIFLHRLLSLYFILFIGSLEIKKLVSLVYFKPNKGKFFFGDQVVGMGPYFLLISLWPYQLGFLRADHMGSFQSVESMLCGQGWEFNKISLYGKKFVNIHEERNEFWLLITMLYFYKHVLEMNKLETRGVSIKINRSNSTKINQNQTNSFDFWIQWNRSNRFTITKRMVWFWIQV